MSHVGQKSVVEKFSSKARCRASSAFVARLARLIAGAADRNIPARFHFWVTDSCPTWDMELSSVD